MGARPALNCPTTELRCAFESLLLAAASVSGTPRPDCRQQRKRQRLPERTRAPSVRPDEHRRKRPTSTAPSGEPINMNVTNDERRCGSECSAVSATMFGIAPPSPSPPKSRRIAGDECTRENFMRPQREHAMHAASIAVVQRSVPPDPMAQRDVDVPHRRFRADAKCFRRCRRDSR